MAHASSSSAWSCSSLSLSARVAVMRLMPKAAIGRATAMLTVEKMYLKWGFVLVFKFGQCTGTYAQGSLLFEDVLGVLGVKVGTKVVVDGLRKLIICGSCSATFWS